MKVLLIFPPAKSPLNYPPLGLCYVASVLEKKGNVVRIIDAANDNCEATDIVRIARHFNPQMIGISVQTRQYQATKEIISKLKDSFPRVSLVCGGPHATLMPRQLLKETACDYVVIGEGERTIVKLVDSINRSRNLAEVNGIAFRKEAGEIIVNKKRKLIGDIDTIPFPARHLIDLNKYKGDFYVRQKPATSILASRGCPFSCSFCSTKALWSNKYRIRSPSKVFEEMMWLYRNHNIKQFYFIDDLFPLERSWLFEFCHLIKKSGPQFSWKCMTRADIVSKESIMAMKDAGCHIIAFGVESGDVGMLKRMNKKMKISQIIDAFTICKKVGIDTWAFFILGYPGESDRSVQKTIHLAKKINADYLTISPAKPRPGTRLQKQVLEAYVKEGDQLSRYRHDDGNSRLISERIENMYLQVLSRRTYLFDNILRKMGRIRNVNDIRILLAKARAYCFYTTKYYLCRLPKMRIKSNLQSSAHS